MRAIVFVLGFFCISLQAAAAQQPVMAQLMTVEQFRAAGLGKLTPEELAALENWVAQFAAEVANYVQQSSSNTTGSSSAVTESRIDGEFTGWEGETIFRLLNGQIWQQSSYAYTYHYSYGPEVVIYRSGSGYKMRVDGVDGEISVTRLR